MYRYYQVLAYVRGFAHVARIYEYMLFQIPNLLNILNPLIVTA